MIVGEPATVAHGASGVQTKELLASSISNSVRVLRLRGVLPLPRIRFPFAGVIGLRLGVTLHLGRVCVIRIVEGGRLLTQLRGEGVAAGRVVGGFVQLEGQRVQIVLLQTRALLNIRLRGTRKRRRYLFEQAIFVNHWNS